MTFDARPILEALEARAADRPSLGEADVQMPTAPEGHFWRVRAAGGSFPDMLYVQLMRRVPRTFWKKESAERVAYEIVYDSTAAPTRADTTAAAQNLLDQRIAQQATVALLGDYPPKEFK